MIHKLHGFKSVGLVIVGLALAAGVAALAQARGGDDPTTREWSWNGTVPGKPVTANAVTAAMARRSGLQPSRLHLVLSAHLGSRAILAARNEAGVICLGYTRREALASEFQCLADDFASRPLVFWASNGGRTSSSVGWAAVTGVARNDVARIALTLSNGTQQLVEMNEWRGFSYYARSERLIPITLSAYQADGSKVADVALALAIPPGS